MQGFGYLQAELQVRQLEHALATERAALAARLGPLPEREPRLPRLRAFFARLLRRGAPAARPVEADRTGVRCGAGFVRAPRCCAACGEVARAEPSHWRGPSRCVRRRRAWTTAGRQPA